MDENRAFLSEFAGKGVDISAIEQMRFLCDFSTHSNAEAFVKEAGELATKAGVSPISVEIDEDDCDLPFLSINTFGMSADAEKISELEAGLTAISQKFDQGRVSWEFADPANPIQQSGET
ncbi:ribonuclease E inhibitor RraB [Actibacterium mucosum]|uniref:ribonuclease E inhibitor RraB n=1 Tax=Actibacterium mucosum TaxID=1087332 RepID=UPI0013776555|nr:ribonuclease E inhibitor RraB [Actibacterium mucosum]